MAKQVILAHPFERVSGNVTREKQTLVYAENNNPAYFGPRQKLYARNFKPCMVLRYNAATGAQSFSIKTKATVDNTPEGHKRMALFGGTQAMIAGIKKNPVLVADLYDEYVEVKDQYKSFNSWLAKWIRYGLSVKLATLDLGAVSMKNPWVGGGTGTDVVVNEDALRKFAAELCPIVIMIDNKAVGYATSNSMTVRQFSEFNGVDFKVKSYELPSGEEIGDILFYKNEIVYHSEKTGTQVYVYAGNAVSTLTDLTMTPPNA